MLVDPRLCALFDQADGPVLATLETYLDLAGDAKASSERLRLHRGTLYYRLQKAEQIADVSLRSGDDRLALRLGFKLARLIGLYPRQAGETAGGAHADRRVAS
jgi:DNA-binding PucR family transcriptional regulator